jgi:ketosteroid isomerase-like protein
MERKSKTHLNLFSINPYRWVLKLKIIKGFEELNLRNYTYLTGLFADNVIYEFEGDHTLGGTRISKKGVEKWFDRLFRLLPSKFIVNSITVSGSMWNTTTIIEFTDTVTPHFGQSYTNNGIQIVKLRFGKAYKIHTYVNTQKIITALNILYENGVLEAKADKIEE